MGVMGGFRIAHRGPGLYGTDLRKMKLAGHTFGCSVLHQATVAFHALRPTRGSLLGSKGFDANLQSYGTYRVRPRRRKGASRQGIEHDSTDGPPIACERVSLSAEDFRSDVVRGTNSRVGENSTIRFSPCLGNAPTIANGEIDLVKINGIPILLFARGCSLQEVLVVGVVVLRMESSRQTEVSELDMASTIKEDVVWLDVTG